MSGVSWEECVLKGLGRDAICAYASPFVRSVRGLHRLLARARHGPPVETAEGKLYLLAWVLGFVPIIITTKGGTVVDMSSQGGALGRALLVRASAWPLIVLYIDDGSWSLSPVGNDGSATTWDQLPEPIQKELLGQMSALSEYRDLTELDWVYNPGLSGPVVAWDYRVPSTAVDWTKVAPEESAFRNFVIDEELLNDEVEEVASTTVKTPQTPPEDTDTISSLSEEVEDPIPSSASEVEEVSTLDTPPSTSEEDD